MKNIFILTISFFISSGAWADEHCFEFDVSAHSKGLKTIQIQLSHAETTMKTFEGVVTARKSEKRYTVTPFSCEKQKGGRIFCSQAKGGGDFLLSRKKDKPTMTLDYLNLFIGSTKGLVFKEDAEIDEEFAILDVKNSEDRDDEDDSGKLGSISLQGIDKACEK